MENETQKSLYTSEIVEIERIFDEYVKQTNACLSQAEYNESLNDFICSYRDNDKWQSIEEFETAVLQHSAWAFACDITAPKNPEPRAREMEQGKPNNGMGYIQKTTFGMDFSIADRFGTDAVQDTYNRAFAEWKNDCIYLTEFVLVLNWKIWEHHENSQTAPAEMRERHEALAQLYNKLWREADEYAMDNLKGDELAYFYNTTD